MELSEEDKKAIESVESMFGDITIEELIKDKNFNITIYSLGILDILKVIAIVENQQKELEEIKLDLEEMEKSNNHKLENWVHKNALNSYISKAKIREKIKELRKEEDEIEKLDYELEPEKAIDCLLLRIADLEELLEEN